MIVYLITFSKKTRTMHFIAEPSSHEKSPPWAILQ